MRASILAIGVAAVGGVLMSCSLVNDPGRHMGGTRLGDGGPGDSGADAGADTSLTPIPSEDYCAALAELACAASNCCPEPVTVDPQCVSQLTTECSNQYDSVLSEEKAGYDEDMAAAVIERGRVLLADCNTAALEWVTYDVLSVLRGESSRGANCAPTDRNDTAAYFSCDADRDLVCRPEGLSAITCQGVSAEGGSCYVLYHCQEGLFCQWMPLRLSGECQPQRANGMECSDGAECRSLYCSEDGICEAPTASIFCADFTSILAEPVTDSMSDGG